MLLAESVKTGDEINWCSCSFVQKAAFCEESFVHVFACLTYKNVQCFWNVSVHEFYSLKASQKSKVRASSHEYPHVEKIKNFREQNFKDKASNKQLDSDNTQQSDFLG